MCIGDDGVVRIEDDAGVVRDGAVRAGSVCQCDLERDMALARMVLIVGREEPCQRVGGRPPGDRIERGEVPCQLARVTVERCLDVQQYIAHIQLGAVGRERGGVR